MSKSIPAFFLLLSSSLAVYCQPSGTLRGVITDESGALVPGATIAVSNAAGPVKTGTSASDGAYSISGLAPGQYSVEAASPGLVQPQPASVNIASGPQPASLNLQLRVAIEKQEVTVQENPGPMVSVDPSQNAGALVLRGADLDALSDDPDDLQADLQALAGPAAGPSGGQIYIDGFTGGTLPSKDSIREIRINQNPFSPEFDKLGYGRIEILTKPGTDKLHGNFNVETGDDIFNSRNPYAAKKAPLLQQQYGGTLSGALTKKASFFIDIFDRNIDSGSIVNAVVAGTNPNGTPFNDVVKAPQNRLRISPRIDYQLSKNNTLTLRYGFTRNDIQDQGIGNFNLASLAAHALNTDHTVQATETAVLSSKVINETRFQLYHQENDQKANYNPPGVVNPAATNVQGSFNGGGAQPARVNDTQNHYELQNYTTIASGAHSWKFGVRVRAVTIDNFSANGATYAFGGKCDPSNPTCLTSIALYQQALQGLAGPSQIVITSGLNPSIAIPETSIHQIDLGGFVGDDWRVKPNLTLSLGLRYETQTNIHDWGDWAPRIGFAWAPGQSKNNPRPRTVFRGGVGIFYDRFSEANVLTVERYLTQPQYKFLPGSSQLPFQFQLDPSGNIVPIVPSLQLLLDKAKAGQIVANHSIQEIDSHLRAPYIIQSAFTVERQLPKNTTVSISYVNSHGLHEFRSQDINAPLQGSYTGSGTGDFPLCPNTSSTDCNKGPVLLMESTGIYNQNQLITNVRSQVNSKISLNGFYMYGRAYSNTDGVNTLPDSPYSMAGEYGPSALDIRHRAFIGGSITTKWRVQLAPFIMLNSGAPFNIITGTDPYGTTLLNTARPEITTSPGFKSYGSVYLNPNPPISCGDSNQSCILPRNFGRSPGSVNVNLRISRTFGFGASREDTAARPRGGGGGGPRGGPGGGGPRGGPPGGFGGGPGFFGGGGGATGKRYNLTLSIQARNLLNHLNPGPITGNVTSPLFGQSNSIAGGFGAFADNANNRRFEFQARFTF
jgi:hypothetical protein